MLKATTGKKLKMAKEWHKRADVKTEGKKAADCKTVAKNG